MGLRAGYKRTVVGVIPEDWGVCNLQGVCDEAITYGIVQCGPHVQNGVPYIRVSDMNSEQLDVAGMLRTAPAIAAQFSRSRVSEGDVVYALRGKIGEVRRVDSEVAGANLTQGTARLSPNSRMNPTYLLWGLRSQHALRQGDLSAKGSTFREITLEALRQIQLPVPPITEQRAIATALSDVDALLAKIDQLIAKKRDLKQAAMQQLLTGQTRLPGFSGEWEVKRLGDVAIANKGTQLPNSESADSGSYAHLNGGVEPSSYTAKANAPGESIAISEGGNSCGFVQFMKDPYWCGGHCYSVVPHGVENGYLYHALKGRQSEIMGLRVGSGLPNIQKSALLNFVVSFPTDKFEQTAIATVLSDMDAELAALEARRDKTRALKQGMMQTLLTGQIRLVGAH